MSNGPGTDTCTGPAHVEESLSIGEEAMSMPGLSPVAASRCAAVLNSNESPAARGKATEFDVECGLLPPAYHHHYQNSDLDAECVLLEVATDAILTSLTCLLSRPPTTRRKRCDSLGDDDGLTNELNNLGTVVDRLRADLEEANIDDLPFLDGAEAAEVAIHLKTTDATGSVDLFLRGTPRALLLAIVFILALVLGFTSWANFEAV